MNFKEDTEYKFLKLCGRKKCRLHYTSKITCRIKPHVIRFKKNGPKKYVNVQ